MRGRLERCALTLQPTNELIRSLPSSKSGPRVSLPRRSTRSWIRGQPVARAILSHAHSDHAVAGHAEIWATPETIALYRRRHPDWTGAARALAYGERPRPDAAQADALSRGSRPRLRAGPIRRRPGARFSTPATSRDAPRRRPRPAETPPADVLLTETTFGLPVFRFPPREELEERLVAACRAALEEGEDAGPSRLRARQGQEAAAILTAAGIPTVLHGAAWKLAARIRGRRNFFSALARLRDRPAGARGGAHRAALLRADSGRTEDQERRVIYLSGWALREASRADFDADVLLPMSDHADFEELLEHVARRRPADGRHAARLRARLRAHPVAAGASRPSPLAEGAERRPEDA